MLEFLTHEVQQITEQQGVLTLNGDNIKKFRYVYKLKKRYWHNAVALLCELKFVVYCTTKRLKLLECTVEAYMSREAQRE